MIVEFDGIMIGKRGFRTKDGNMFYRYTVGREYDSSIENCDGYEVANYASNINYTSKLFAPIHVKLDISDKDSKVFLRDINTI